MVLPEDLISGNIFMQGLLSGCRRLKQQVIFVDTFLVVFVRYVFTLQSNLF